ncbi:carbohydrate ABC transporter membrane protein 2 (CUT1 family) [Saccharothrix saharensis]|uniref:Carbohydrate ABC transporter membrane protein 2 (CUT1 family) n=1 Tax=Saccharothrix saharensis TaxID=571190 RepID=A0A543J6X9_9PSEU|nr:carbohydrate ABC transporter permease [Saccharothrix saharensis]TQM78584.1 carbohydrate ABC transporter membrane protein 2 (CUT1 family) [Saccharothrix saharensis]
MTTGRFERIAGRLVVLVLVTVTIVPFADLFLTALHPPGTYPPGFTWPRDPHWSNFATAFRDGRVGGSLASSALVVLGVVPLTLALAAPAGYALGHLRFPGHRVVSGLYAVGLVLPLEAIVTPLYHQVRDLGLLDTRGGLVAALVAVHLPFAVLWSRAHFAGVPPELSDSARSDGAGPWQVFRRVHLPLARPALSSLAVLLLIWTWNHFLLAIVLVDDPARRTAAGALGAFQGRWGTDVPLLCAGSILLVTPLLVVFALLHRRLSADVTSTVRRAPTRGHRSAR